MTTISQQEFQLLLKKCAALPPAKGDYLIQDYVENVFLTVVDFMQKEIVVPKMAFV